MAVPKTLSEKASVAARLASWSYIDDPKVRRKLVKQLLNCNNTLIAINNAECMIVKADKQLWIAFRGTQPNQLNDLKAA